MPEGTIVGMSGSWSSGLATLLVETDEGIDAVFCDNAPTVRALDSAFGGVIGPGHTINVRAVKGKKIHYSVDLSGVLEGFTPIE